MLIKRSLYAKGNVCLISNKLQLLQKLLTILLEIFHAITAPRISTLFWERLPFFTFFAMIFYWYLSKYFITLAYNFHANDHVDFLFFFAYKWPFNILYWKILMVDACTQFFLNCTCSHPCDKRWPEKFFHFFICTCLIKVLLISMTVH